MLPQQVHRDARARLDCRRDSRRTRATGAQHGSRSTRGATAAAGRAACPAAVTSARSAGRRGVGRVDTAAFGRRAPPPSPLVRRPRVAVQTGEDVDEQERDEESRRVLRCEVMGRVATPTCARSAHSSSRCARGRMPRLRAMRLTRTGMPVRCGRRTQHELRPRPACPSSDDPSPSGVAIRDAAIASRNGPRFVRTWRYAARRSSNRSTKIIVASDWMYGSAGARHAGCAEVSVGRRRISSVPTARAIYRSSRKYCSRSERQNGRVDTYTCLEAPFAAAAAPRDGVDVATTRGALIHVRKQATVRLRRQQTENASALSRASCHPSRS